MAARKFTISGGEKVNQSVVAQKLAAMLTFHLKSYGVGGFRSSAEVFHARIRS